MQLHRGRKGLFYDPYESFRLSRKVGHLFFILPLRSSTALLETDTRGNTTTIAPARMLGCIRSGSDLLFSGRFSGEVVFIIHTTDRSVPVRLFHQ